MVKQLKIALAFIRLIRLPNLVIIGLTQYFIRWFVLKPLLKSGGFDVRLSSSEFAFLVLSTMLIAAAGYIINDYFDRKADLINKPGRVIVGRMIRRRYAMAMHLVFTGIGLLLGTYTAYRIGELRLSVVFYFAAGVLWFYSTVYKRQLLVGNIIISILVGMVPVLVLMFEMPLLLKSYRLQVLTQGLNFDYLIFWIAAYGGFAFLINLIREIIKDIEDYEGDAVFGRRTVPIHWGVHTAKWIVTALVITAILPVFYLLAFHLADKISFVYIVFFIIVPLMFLAFGTLWATSKKQYHILSMMAKLIMLTGLLYCPVFTLLVNKLQVF